MTNWEPGSEPREHYAVEAARIEAKRLVSGDSPATEMTWAFEVDAAGLVWVEWDERYPGFSATLADALGSLSPAGEAPRLSTYWVDRTLTWLNAGGDEDPAIDVASGNATVLQRHGLTVKAIAQYEQFPTEELPKDEVILGLLRWSERSWTVSPATATPCQRMTPEPWLACGARRTDDRGGSGRAGQRPGQQPQTVGMGRYPPSGEAVWR